MKRIGLYGGSFNPIHMGHMQIAERACSTFHLDRIIFIPANISPLKDPHSLEKNEHRLKMLELALTGHSCFEISRFELDRGGKSFTIDTIRHFLSKYTNFSMYLIIGEDSLNTISQWKSFKEILTSIDLIVYPRKSLCTEKSPGLLKDFKKSSKLPRKRTCRETCGGHHLYYIDAPHILISSSEVRTSIAKLSLNQNLLPQIVARYIEENALYREG